jgi:hypothetical protein
LRKSRPISFNERTIQKWTGRSISVFKGIFPIFGLPSPISGCCKPRFLDFQSRFLVNLPKIFFRYEIHLIFRMRCKFPFFGVISDFRRAKKTRKTSTFLTVLACTSLINPRRACLYFFKKPCRAEH